MAYRVDMYTESIGGHDMVKRWEIVDDGNSAVPDFTIAISSVVIDFFTNYLDYEIVGTALVKIGSPLNETLNRPRDNFDYPMALTRATNMSIFGSL